MFIETDVIRLSDGKHVYCINREFKKLGKAIGVFEKAKSDILDPSSPFHEVMQRNAEKYFPINR